LPPLLHGRIGFAKNQGSAQKQEEGGTMVRTASLFSQLLGMFPRTEFAGLVRKHGSDRGAKGFDSWTQFVAMMFCQLSRADSLREICNGLACCIGKLSHLGVSGPPNKSTLSYANAHRPHEMFEELFFTTMDRFRSMGPLGARKSRFRFKNKLYSLDSTTISLCLSLFPWAGFRKTKGGVKAHVLLDHDDYLPSYVLLTEARRHDVTIARGLRIPSGSIVVMDRAYVDFDLFADWDRQGVQFVTRMKDNTVFSVFESFEVPERGRILADQLIELTGVAGERACPDSLFRRVVVWDPVHECELVLITNITMLAASTIAAIYKERWEIELFFKCLKQNLKVKTFVGTTENALRIQIWTALIALLLIKWAHHLSRAAWSLSNLAHMLRLNLFTYRDFMAWLHNPFGTPPLTPEPSQLNLSFTALGQPTVSYEGASI
jgi:hypothetical protein